MAYNVLNSGFGYDFRMDVAKKAAEAADARERTKTLAELLEQHKWEFACQRVRKYPEEAKIMFTKRRSPLQAACYFGSTPVRLVVALVEAYPEALALQDDVNGETPLHSACRNAQRTSGKISALLEAMRRGHDDGLLPPVSEILAKRNHRHDTALHVACGYNAMQDVIEELVKADLQSLLLQTGNNFARITPLKTQVTAYESTVPGQLAISRILSSDRPISDTSGTFQRFWGKMEFMAIGTYQVRRGLPFNPYEESSRRLLLHALISEYQKACFVKIALKRDPSLANEVNHEGNTLLHVVTQMDVRSADNITSQVLSMNRRYVQVLTKSYPWMASRQNPDGETPLTQACRHGFRWERDCLKEIVESDPSGLSLLSPDGMYPVMLVAMAAGPTDAESTTGTSGDHTSMTSFASSKGTHTKHGFASFRLPLTSCARTVHSRYSDLQRTETIYQVLRYDPNVCSIGLNTGS